MCCELLIINILLILFGMLTFINSSVGMIGIHTILFLLFMLVTGDWIDYESYSIKIIVSKLNLLEENNRKFSNEYSMRINEIKVLFEKCKKKYIPRLILSAILISLLLVFDKYIFNLINNLFIKANISYNYLYFLIEVLFIIRFIALGVNDNYVRYYKVMDRCDKLLVEQHKKLFKRDYILNNKNILIKLTNKNMTEYEYNEYVDVNDNLIDSIDIIDQFEFKDKIYKCYKFKYKWWKTEPKCKKYRENQYFLFSLD